MPLLGFKGDNAREKVAVLLTMCFALAMAMLDNTVVNIALRTIGKDLDDHDAFDTGAFDTGAFAAGDFAAVTFTSRVFGVRASFAGAAGASDAMRSTGAAASATPFARSG